VAADNPQLIYFVIRGMIELGDSIGQDLANQVRALSAAGLQCRTFAEVYKSALYSDLKIESIDRLSEALDSRPAPVIYHWCDGWYDVDRLLASHRASLIVRWHNNTPPWFFAPYSLDATSRTLRGYSGLLKLVDSRGIRVLANSRFSARQLEILGIPSNQVRVAYPVSDYLRAPRARRDASPSAPGKLTLLFVGRIVPHKGHRHILRSAAVLRTRFGIDCRILFPGRRDPSMHTYAAELSDLAGKLGVGMDLLGEVDNRQLEEMYAKSDVFVCLSEHEGFGLPVIEAMRAQLPVVGYRSSAVAETLGEHPLACDHLDYHQIAARIACLVDSDVSRDVVSFQNEVLLPRFSSEVCRAQFLAAIDLDGVAKEPAPSSVNGTHAAISSARVSSALQRALDRLGPSEVREQYGADAGDRYVTLNDIRAYEALIAKAGTATETLGFRDACMNMSFQSPRPLLGRLIDKVKRLVLYSQDGVVTSLSKSHTELAARLDRIESRLDRLSTDGRRGAPADESNHGNASILQPERDIIARQRKP
jgi:glycosyltransferase involved in cell wall biosynthesis/bifunctional DNA-binding transcriptional regulator/antitoxin component of YhaV-PrlF toxin-antitoxin module